MDIITTPSYEEMQQLYSRYYSLGYLCYKLRQKKPDVTPYRIIKKIIGDNLPEDFIKGLLKETCWEPKALEKDKRSNALSMEWGGYYVADMLKPIYEDANIYLDRKYLKFIEIKTCRSKLKPRKTWDDDGGIKRGGCKMLIRTEGVTI